MKSPFQTARFEYEGEHLYFLPTNFMNVLELPKPVYLIGSRGTGKTTLLKALNWNERINNTSLQRQLGSDIFIKRYIGVYFKLPDHRFDALDAKLQQENKDLGNLIRSLYIDVLGLQLLVDAISELIINKIIMATPKDEQKCVTSILEDFEEWFQPIIENIFSKKPATLKNLNNLFRSIQLTIERYAIYGGEASSVASDYTGQIGEFGRCVAKRLGELCNIQIDEPMYKWFFKICMDEGECLSNNDRLVFNTMTRLSEWPLFHVVCFVERPEDISSTLIPNLTLSDADRTLILLEDMTDREFRILGEGVATIRMQELLEDFTVKFDTKMCLGKLNINKMAMSILEESTSRKAKDLLANAREKMKDPIICNMLSGKADQRADDEDTLIEKSEEINLDLLPIYQTYLIQKLNLVLPTPDDPQWARRAQESAELRKKMVAAYLSLCDEMGMNVRYATADMVLQMSDKCIRDFLTFIHEIFIESKFSLHNFIKNQVPMKIQDKAIKHASNLKRNSLKQSGIISPTEAGRIIDALAKITKYIQTKSPDLSHLEATERGKFTLSMQPTEREIFTSVLKLIKDAAQAGFLIISQEGESKWKFRVHTSLAAFFGFSYRGAYYDTPLDIKELDAIRQSSDLDDFEKHVEKISKRLAGWKNDIGTLFEWNKDGNSI